MQPDERMRALHQAIVHADATMVSAAINALPWLTGLSTEEQATIRDKWQTHWHGDTLGRTRASSEPGKVTSIG